MKSAFVIFVALAAAACRNGTGPYEDVSVSVDSAVYHLKANHSVYTINLTATISNNSDHDIYLSRFCPTFAMARPAGFSGELQFGQYACALPGGTPTPTLTLTPGATHSESFRLQGMEQPQARPQITLHELTGPAAFGFFVSADLKSFKTLMSGPFILATAE